MSNIPIPFNKPNLFGGETEKISDLFQVGRIGGDWEFTKKCQELLEIESGAAKVFLTSSCTHALEMAAILLDFEQGDEVIIPSYTFVSTANAFLLRGGRPIFVDIDPKTLNLDPLRVEEKVNIRTKAIVPIHYGGVSAEMKSICEIAERHGFHVVEDNAHGLFGRYRGKALGSFGTLATQSFDEAKNFTCGQGGALVVNDPSLVERAEVIRDRGTNRGKFFRREADRYQWVDLGSNYALSEINAAILLFQLENRERIQARRKMIWERYRDSLDAWAKCTGSTLPHVPSDCIPSYHIFYILFPERQIRDSLIDKLAEKKISCLSHYSPLHLSLAGKKLGYKEGDCPVAESLSERLLRLPLFFDLKTEDQTRIIDVILESKI